MKINEVKINAGRRTVDVKKVKELAESIKQLGLLNPITVNEDGTLIAGMHRLEACKLLGYEEIKVNKINLNLLLAELAEIDENLIRNELHWLESDKQLKRRKAIYEELHPETKQGTAGAIGKHNSANEIISSAKTFTEDTADKLGQSQRNIQMSVARAENIIEEVEDDIKELDITKTEGTILARFEPEQQKKIIEVKKQKTDFSIKEIVQEIKKEEKNQIKLNERDRLAEIGKNKKIEIDFRLGDFEEVFADLPDGSIDCIITDPPYPYEFIEVWTKLSRFAKRVLKPNGYCIAYSGQMYLPEVIKRMNEHLDYYWTFAVYHEGQTQIVNGINLMCRWKPVLIFQNGKKKIENTFQDYFISEQREKNGHDWQQSKSGVGYLIEMFTKEGDTIFEPFAGSGTTIIAARDKNRNILSAEIDEKTYNIAKALL
jgi:ParB-like chromosome segregation protein Spo0J